MKPSDNALELARKIYCDLVYQVDSSICALDYDDEEEIERQALLIDDKLEELREALQGTIELAKHSKTDECNAEWAMGIRHDSESALRAWRPQQ